MKRPTHYDFIPEHLLEGSILDVGCGDMSNQTKSKYRDLFLKKLQTFDYCGIDIEQDIFKWESKTLFDTVLAIHVIEHIPLQQWELLFSRLRSFVAPQGHLVIGTPYKQQNSAYYQYFKGPPAQKHVVFDIDEYLIRNFIAPIEVIRYKGPYSESLMCIWRNKQ